MTNEPKTLPEQIAFQELLVEAMGYHNTKRDPHERAQQLFEYQAAKAKLNALRQKLEHECRKQAEAEVFP